VPPVPTTNQKWGRHVPLCAPWCRRLWITVYVNRSNVDSAPAHWACLDFSRRLHLLHLTRSKATKQSRRQSGLLQDMGCHPAASFYLVVSAQRWQTEAALAERLALHGPLPHWRCNHPHPIVRVCGQMWCCSLAFIFLSFYVFYSCLSVVVFLVFLLAYSYHLLPLILVLVYRINVFKCGHLDNIMTVLISF